MTDLSIYRELFVDARERPDLMISTLSVLTTMFNQTESPRKDISDFIRDCAAAGISGDAPVILTRDSIALYAEDDED